MSDISPPPSWWRVLQQTRETMVFILAHMVLGTTTTTIFPCRAAAEATLICLPATTGIFAAVVVVARKGRPSSILLWGVLSAVGCATSLGSLLVLSAGLSRKQLHNFQSPTPVATEYLKEGLRTGRIERCDGFTLYRPLSTTTVVFVFFTGALLPSEAYARVAGKLTENGSIAVAVVDPPAARLIAPIFGTTSQLELLRQHVETALLLGSAQSFSSSLRWAVGGHSMGSCAAEHAACHLAWIDHLVYWGSYRVPSTKVRDNNVQVLAVGASNDTFGFASKPPADRVAYVDRMHAMGCCQVYEVVGGNHNGFADYPPQTFPLQDGVRDIGLDQQHQEVVTVTREFLLHHLT